MSQPDMDLTLGTLPAKKSRIVATWKSDCGTFPNPRLETASIEDGLLVAQCNHCAATTCKVRRFIRTELI
jgi:hypothetical protein